MPSLFDPLKLGTIAQLPNRIIMAPLTRCRAGDVRITNDMMLKYYTQRASAGLIITEATSVDPMGVGYPGTPGIWSKDQVEGWKKITRAVHNAGGRIILQLWHVGRVSHQIYLNGAQPVAPSAIAVKGHVRLYSKSEAYPVPRALTLAEIPEIVAAFSRGAKNAQAAGFDGVEIHGANGYLLDQFLQDKSNQRTDIYGGSIENRARFMLEVTDAVTAVFGAQKVGMHLAPRGDTPSMGDSNPLMTFSYVAMELARRNLAFICTREHSGEGRIGPQLKKVFGGPFIANENFTFETASEAVAKGEVDAVAFGKSFIANPDLPERFKKNAALNTPKADLFYTPGAEGYTDYPRLGELTPKIDEVASN